jgi:hypothetical protein
MQFRSCPPRGMPLAAISIEMARFLVPSVPCSLFPHSYSLSPAFIMELQVLPPLAG